AGHASLANRELILLARGFTAREILQMHLIPNRRVRRWQEIAEADCCDARDARQCIEESLLHLSDFHAVLVPRCADMECCTVRRMEAGIEMREVVVAAQ